MELSDAAGRFSLDLRLQPSISDDETGFTERFLRRLFYDNVYCLRQYLSEIRPQRRGTARPKATAPLDVAGITITESSLLIEQQQVMQAWERPLMERMAEGICKAGDSILEIGFGLGISARAIQSIGPRRHVIVEANPAVAELARTWGADLASSIEIIQSRWEAVDFGEQTFDGVIFDAYPSDEDEVQNNLNHGRVAAEKFFATAQKLTAAGGTFTFYSGCEFGLPLRLQDELLRRFGTVRLERVSGLTPPDDCNYWISSQMIVAFAGKLAG
jgi:guanidinoacetate N-methyltransferase